MSRHIRLHGRPMWAVGSSPPPLQLVGSLPNYSPGDSYEGRLSILNNIGPCGVEILWDESSLPAGAAAEVDMANLQVVVTWPAYTPPEEVKTSIVNGDFQAGTLEGWHDLRGSYRVKKYEDDDTNVGPGDRPRPPGNMAAWMEGFGRGDHILESDRYPVQQGQNIMARSLWDQGPSNKDNNNLWTAIGLWNNDLFLGEVRGDRIHDRTNRSRHWSTVNHTVGLHETDITIRLIAHRRNGRNRPIIVDNVETSGLTYSVGQDDPAEFYYLTLRLWDSAGRVALWSGIIISTAFRLLTTGPYPLVAIDSMRSSGSVQAMDGYNSPTVSPHSGAVSTGAVMSLELWVSQAYHEYSALGASAASGGSVVALSLEVTSSHSQTSAQDSALTSGAVTALSMGVTTNYINYTEPTNAVGTAGSVVGIEMQ